jgi:hypothetical protein
MAFKMKGPMFFKSALKNYKDTTKYKAFQAGNDAGSTFKHYVGDNPEHQDPKLGYGNHSDDLQTDEEHKAGKVESKGGEDKTYFNALVAKEKVGPKPPNAKGITRPEQSALDRLRSEEG